MLLALAQVFCEGLTTPCQEYYTGGLEGFRRILVSGVGNLVDLIPKLQVLVFGKLTLEWRP